MFKLGGGGRIFRKMKKEREMESGRKEERGEKKEVMDQKWNRNYGKTGNIT